MLTTLIFQSLLATFPDQIFPVLQNSSTRSEETRTRINELANETCSVGFTLSEDLRSRKSQSHNPSHGRCYATLHLALPPLSVGWLVGHLLLLQHLLAIFAILLLPKCMVSLIYPCTCPLVCYWGSRVCQKIKSIFDQIINIKERKQKNFKPLSGFIFSNFSCLPFI